MGIAGDPEWPIETSDQGTPSLAEIEDHVPKIHSPRRSAGGQPAAGGGRIRHVCWRRTRSVRPAGPHHSDVGHNRFVITLPVWEQPVCRYRQWLVSRTAAVPEHWSRWQLRTALCPESYQVHPRWHRAKHYMPEARWPGTRRER